MLSWEFGDIIRDSYSRDWQKGFLEDNIIVDTRREYFTDVEDFIKGYIILEEIEDITLFYEDETKFGTIPFTFYDCVSGLTRTANFIDRPNNIRLSNKYRVNISLRFEPLPIENKDPILSTGRITEDSIQRLTEAAIERVTE